MTVCPQCREFVNSQPIKPGGIFYCASRKWKDVDNCPVFKELCKMSTEARDPLLQEREKTHGSFKRNAEISQELKRLFRDYDWGTPPGGERNRVFQESLDMIALKLSRILSGQANFKDHWDDIAGYAKLASETCKGE